MSKTLEAIQLLEDRLKNLLANYEFLKECESKLCEITGYDKYEYCKKDLMKYLFILKNVHNKY